MARSSKSAPSQSTAQQLASLVKSCRDIMRKDKGLNGDLDRLPMLTWIMFLKFLDDMERVREEADGGNGPAFPATYHAQAAAAVRRLRAGALRHGCP